jgi:CheY-like chemotaxis protein
LTTILVIDDEPLVLNVIENVLTLEGYSIVTACNGARGLEVLERQSVDLVITDVFMPEKEGLETVFELRSLYPDLPVIAISGGGYTKCIDPLPCLRVAGACRTMAKPFKNAELSRTVAEVLELYGSAA